MATYKEIKGVTVQTLDSDPVVNVGAWSSGGAMNTAREGHGAAGTQDAALAFTGNSPPQTVNNEQYNGTSWTELANVNTGRYGIGSATSGTTTAALGWGGLEPSPSTKTESWNGSAWSEVNDLNDEKYYLGGIGTQTAALAFGGARGGDPEPILDESETWNGSSWTEGNNLNTGRKYISGTGSSTAGLAIGGTEPSTSAKVESYNGTSWTETTDINTARYGGASSSGPYTSSVFFGGSTGSLTGVTENWDGTSWTEVSDMSAARTTLGGNGTSSAALAHGGQSPVVATTEEWTTTPSALFQKTVEGQLFFNSTTNAFKETITDLAGGAWASGANINTAREGTAGAGDSAEAALLVGGYTTSAPTIRVANTESWNGSTWTEVNDLNSARYLLESSGTNTAALAYGGNTPPPAVTAVTESWNGSSWTEVNDLNTARQSLAGVGPYTSALAFGGTTPTKVGNTETWDGSSWTETSDLNTARGLQASVGVTQTAALSVSGNFPQANQVEEWDGSSWTEIAEVNTARYEASGSGSSTIGLIFGGRILGGSPPAAYSALTESWNGTAWTERADLATARGDGASANNISNNSKALYFSGSNPPYVYTEEWTAPLANKTITAS